MSTPLNRVIHVLTEHRELDIMHRRAGRDARPLKGGAYGHGDAHKYCPLGRCGTRPGGYHQGSYREDQTRSRKITAWRKYKAASNRAYLEESVYGQSKYETDAMVHEHSGVQHDR